MNFYIGQKVVCVKPSTKKSLPSRARDVIVGNVYTVRGLPINSLGEEGLYVEEITNPINPFEQIEFGFYRFRFRPVVERKTDISIFTAMLNPSKRRISA